LRQSVAELEARLAELENQEKRTVIETNHETPDRARVETLSSTVASLENTVVNLTTRYDGRLAELETRVGNHEAKLKDVPTLAEVVTTMEDLLTKTMTDLDEKLSEQVRSIDVLKTTVAQSDELMERVLDSIYSLQSDVAQTDKSEVPVHV